MLEILLGDGWRAKVKSSHVLFAFFAVSGAIALKDYSEAGFIVFLFTTAEWLETRASRKVCMSLSAILFA